MESLDEITKSRALFKIIFVFRLVVSKGNNNQKRVQPTRFESKTGTADTFRVKNGYSLNFKRESG